jgi:hypothetical protein
MEEGKTNNITNPEADTSVGQNITNLFNKAKTGIQGNIFNPLKDGFNKITKRSNNSNQDLKSTTNDGIVSYAQENHFYVVAITIVILFLAIVFFFSSSFRVGRTLDYIEMYPSYQNIISYPFGKGVDRYKLSQLYVASSYNPCSAHNITFDYLHLDILKAILKSGARYIELEVFNDKYSPDAVPIVSTGNEAGEWKLSLNTLTFDDCCKVIAENAFKIQDGDKGVPNPEDPLFIGLNLKTNGNLFTLDTINDILLDYFEDYMIKDHRYQYQQKSLGDIEIGILREKVVIISSNGFQGSKLEEIVNSSWDNPKRMRRYHYSELEALDFDELELRNFNKKNLTIVVPNSESDFGATNYDMNFARNCGCQFICMNYQHPDNKNYIGNYIDFFKAKGIKKKPSKMM